MDYCCVSRGLLTAVPSESSHCMRAASCSESWCPEVQLTPDVHRALNQCDLYVPYTDEEIARHDVRRTTLNSLK